MTRRLLRRYAADRAWLFAAYVLAVAVLVGFFGLVLSFRGATVGELAGDVAYALLVSVLVLALCLAVDLARWLPAARWLETLRDPDLRLEMLASQPTGGTREQAHAQQLTFVGMWAHQMKTPLAAISLAVQEASHGGQDAQAALASIEEETLKLADGLELVLNTTRLQDFALDYHVRRVDLLDSVRRVINARKKQFIRLGIFPTVEAAEGEDWHVLTDEKWNAFAIDQIVSNALKYGSQVAGAASQRLRFLLRRDGEAVALAVADQGPGILPQDVPRVFEPFFTGENGRRYAHATGFGLYLVRRVMDHLGHEVRVHSVEGAGTTVTLRYPLAPRTTRAADSSRSPGAQPPHEPQPAATLQD